MLFRRFIESKVRDEINSLKEKVKRYREERRSTLDESDQLRAKLSESESARDELSESLRAIQLELSNANLQLKELESAVDLLEIQRETLLEQVYTYLKLRRAENLVASQTEARVINANHQSSRESQSGR